MIKNKLDSSNKELALDFILKCYTEYFSEPKALEGANQLHLDRMKELTDTFDKADQEYLIKEGLNIHANGSSTRDNCINETATLKREKRQAYLAGTRTKLEDVKLVDIPKIFLGEVEEVTDEDDTSTETKELRVPKKPKTHLKAKMSILSDKIKSVSMDDDMKFVKTLYDIINMQEDSLLNAMKDKLDYLGVEPLDSYEFSSEMPKNELFEEICSAFLEIEFTEEKDISNLLIAMENYLK